ncbi:MAG: copper chaperone PCu(A)C [Boseongicola sp.]
MMARTILALASLFTSVAAASADVFLTDPWARASILASRPGAAYLTLESTENDKLIKLSTPMAAKVMIHSTETGTDGVSRMHHMMSLDLPAGQVVTLAPGGLHLMLMGIASKLEEGTSFPMTLEFEKAGAVTIEVQVLSAAAAGPEDTGE